MLVNGLSLQMSVSHSVPKYMLIMYYEILIIRQEKERANTLSLFSIFFLNNDDRYWNLISNTFLLGIRLRYFYYRG